MEWEGRWTCWSLGPPRDAQVATSQRRCTRWRRARWCWGAGRDLAGEEKAAAMCYSKNQWPAGGGRRGQKSHFTHLLSPQIWEMIKIIGAVCLGKELRICGVFEQILVLAVSISILCILAVSCSKISLIIIVCIGTWQNFKYFDLLRQTQENGDISELTYLFIFLK